MSSSSSDWFAQMLVGLKKTTEGPHSKPARRKGYVKDSTSALLLRECSSCKKLKNLFDFPKDKSRVSGLYPACKACVREKRRKDLDENERLRAEGNHAFETMPEGGYGMVCARCKELKPVGEYHKDKYAFTGLRPECKACAKARSGSRA